MDNDYSFSAASLEIIIALAAAFIAGALLCYLLRLLIRIVTFPFRRRDRQDRPYHDAYQDDTLQNGAATAGFQSSFPTQTQPAAPRIPLPAPPEPPLQPQRLSTEGGAFEADINTLLRRNNVPDNSHIEMPEHAPNVASFKSRVRESLSSANSTRLAEILRMPPDDHIDDLKKLEGIGPRIEGLLNQYGIKSYARLAVMDRDDLRDILEAGGSEFKMHEPKSWPYQAELAAKENWDRLREYQEFLMEGRGH